MSSSDRDDSEPSINPAGAEVDAISHRLSLLINFNQSTMSSQQATFDRDDIPPNDMDDAVIDNVDAFIDRILLLPPGPVDLNSVLQPSVIAEHTLRLFFATRPDHPRLTQYVGLVDAFDIPEALRVTRPRFVSQTGYSHPPWVSKYIFPLWDHQRRFEGRHSLVEREVFEANFDVFTSGALSLISWNNVLVAGGSVLACMTPTPDYVESLHYFYHEKEYPTSDIDLFIYGLNEEQVNFLSRVHHN